jgi:hypothetical protein
MATTPAHAPKAPVEPVAPGLDDCCRNGCTPCVFDLYEEAMERYRKELAQYRKACGQDALGN